MLVYVWAYEQQGNSSYGRKFATQDVMVPWKLQQQAGGALTEQEREAARLEKTSRGKAKAAAKKAKKAAEKAAKKAAAAGGGVSLKRRLNPQTSSPQEEAEEAEAAPQETETPPAGEAPVLQRYYHVFVEGELEELVAQAPELSIRESFFDHANWCVIVRKAPPPVAVQACAFAPLAVGGLGLPRG